MKTQVKKERIYQKIQKEKRLEAIMLRNQGKKHKRIAQLTGINPKTIATLKLNKKYMHDLYTDRIKEIILEYGMERGQLLQINKNIQRIINSKEDGYLNYLIRSNQSKTPKRRVIERISKELKQDYLYNLYLTVNEIQLTQQFHDVNSNLEVNQTEYQYQSQNTNQYQNQYSRFYSENNRQLQSQQYERNIQSDPDDQYSYKNQPQESEFEQLQQQALDDQNPDQKYSYQDDPGQDSSCFNLLFRKNQQMKNFEQFSDQSFINYQDH